MCVQYGLTYVKNAGTAKDLDRCLEYYVSPITHQSNEEGLHMMATSDGAVRPDGRSRLSDAAPSAAQCSENKLDEELDAEEDLDNDYDQERNEDDSWKEVGQDGQHPGEDAHDEGDWDEGFAYDFEDELH